MHNPIHLLTTGLWTWLARILLGDLGTDWVFDSHSPEESQRWLFGAIEDRTYATPAMLEQPAGERQVATFNLFRSALFEAVSNVTCAAAAVVVSVLAIAQGLFFGIGVN